MNIYSPITTLQGIGPTRAKQLEKLDIRTIYDLIAYFPRTYEDRTKLVDIRDLEPDIPACFEAGTKGHGDRGHVPVSAQVLLGQDGIHHRHGLQSGNGIPSGVYQ